MCERIAVGALLAGWLIVANCAAGPVNYSGGVMVNSSGMTLYTFDKDPAGAGKSVCNGPCAANWPPFKAAGADTATGEFAIITRDDGTKQWAYKGKPLYLYSNDQKSGDKTGDGFNKVWHVIKEEGQYMRSEGQASPFPRNDGY